MGCSRSPPKSSRAVLLDGNHTPCWPGQSPVGRSVGLLVGLLRARARETEIQHGGQGRGAAAAVKDIKENLEYVESFDNVVLCFDKDKPGQEAAKKVATILKPGKAKIVTLPNGYKDANDMLNKGLFKEFTSSWWDAKVYTPSGIIRVSEKQSEFLNRERKESIPYPWEGLNKKLYGL